MVPGRNELLQNPSRVLPLRFTAGSVKSTGVRKNRLINEATRVMHQGNAFKLGTFASNCASGLTITKHPDRWSGSWEDNLRLARMLDEAGIDFMLPIARWLGFGGETRSEEHTSELQSLMRISYAVFCLKKK